jgi:hypothetical protein
MLNFNKPLISEGKSKMANGSKTRFSNYKSAALNQLSYAGVYEGKYSVTRLRRVAFHTPFLYGKV